MHDVRSTVRCLAGAPGGARWPRWPRPATAAPAARPGAAGPVGRGAGTAGLGASPGLGPEVSWNDF